MKIDINKYEWIASSKNDFFYILSKKYNEDRNVVTISEILFGLIKDYLEGVPSEYRELFIQFAISYIKLIFKQELDDEELSFDLDTVFNELEEMLKEVDE